MDLAGQMLGQYYIVEPLGHGGMATVYKAYQPALERHVAIKVLLPHQASTAEFRERFNREAKVVAQLNHPNILPIIDYGQHDGLSYIVMKYVAGGTLADRLKQPIDLATTARLIAQIAAALDHAHQRGIIHRDIKPTNVLLDEGEWVQLADFGLVKLLYGDQMLTRSGLSMGTPAYLSPEQGQGIPLDHHADIYSLSVIVYEMITGRLPFTAETAMGVIVKHIYDQPALPRALNPNLPEAVQAVVLKGLSKTPTERYASAGELAGALQTAVSSAPSMQFAPVQGIDSNVTPHISLRVGTPTPIVISNKVLFEETVPAVPHFVGRAAELAAYQTRLERDQFVLITGMAGMGKTTLGARLARNLTPLPDEIFWFTFDPVEKHTADALYWALASFLDSRGEPSLAKYLRGEIGAQKPLERAARLNLLIAALATGHYVLCFDDFQIVKDVPDIAYIFTVIRQRFLELKQALPAHFIIIGREVPPDLEYLSGPSLPGLSAADTNALLADRGVVLPQDLTQQLWERTGGNPKLLELAMGSLAGLPDSSAANFIATLARKGDIRDYLLTNIYATLTPEEQVVMGALSVFPGPIERAGLEELLAEESIGNLIQRLDALANKHVLTVDDDDRIDCHDLVRDYGYHVLNRRDRDRFHQRAAIYFETEQNWLAAAYHHFERRDVARALELLSAHSDDIINSGGADALSQQLGRFNVAMLTPEQRLGLYKTQGNALSIRGEYQPAIAAYHTALDEAVPDDQRAEILWLIGRTYLKFGDYQSTLEYCGRSLQLSEKSLGNQIGVARANHDQGWAHYRLGHIPEAARHFEIAERIARTSHETLLAARTNMALGVTDLKENRLASAQERFEASRRVFREQGMRIDEANAIGNLGLIFHAQQNTSREIVCYLQAADIFEQIGDIHGLLFALFNLGDLYLAERNWGEAVHSYTRLAQLAQESVQKPMLSLAYCGLADCYLAQSEIRRALDYAVQARKLAEEFGAGLEMGLSSRVLGDVWLALDDAAQARRYFEESIPLLEQYQEPEDLVKAQNGYQMALSRLKSNPIP